MSRLVAALAIVISTAGAAWAQQNVDHAKTRFPLVGKHKVVACESCHPSAGGGQRKWAGVPRDCHGCHGDRKNHKGALGAKCESCHVAEEWKRLLHDAASHKMPLTGAHKQECASCHKEGAHLVAKVACAECHKQTHGGTKAACDTCHRPETWKAVSFKHKINLALALPGKHVGAKCLGCHPSFAFAGTNVRCESCHMKDLKHDDQGECSKCHTPTTWKKQTGFDHAAPPINFPLVEKHAGVPCIQCHKVKDVFTGQSRACASCHVGPKHGDLGACDKCHTTAGFAKPGFDHASTRFALDGKHAGVACAQCHGAKLAPGAFVPGPQACATCHADPHKGQFGARTCSNCHDARGWAPSLVDVERHAGFRMPLTGVHARTACAQCHKGGVFTATSTQCRDCHVDRHHGMLGTGCEKCHNPSGWKNRAPVDTGARAGFDHAARTGFALVGSHAKVACEKCHGPGDAKMKALARPIGCASCHTPKHTDAYGPKCERCHTVTKFADGKQFDHTRTLFPLERRHRAIACASCHDPKKRPPDPNCQTCHGDPHGGRTFLDCGDCHRADSWLIIRYDHDRAEFPLKGRHFFTPCRDCHSNDVWTGVRRDCVSCHRGDAQRANMLHPDHAAFEWECIDCHRPWDWGARP